MPRLWPGPDSCDTPPLDTTPNAWSLDVKRLILLLLLGLAACGEPTDREQDCNASEFFEQASQRCQPCPPLTSSACDEDCGFRIVTSMSTGCPDIQCALRSADENSPRACLCPDTERFDPETQMCAPR